MTLESRTLERQSAIVTRPQRHGGFLRDRLVALTALRGDPRGATIEN